PSTAWGPDLLRGRIRGGERAGDCLRPPKRRGTTARSRELRSFRRGLRPDRVHASRPPAPAADPAAELVGSGRAQGPPPHPTGPPGRTTTATQSLFSSAPQPSANLFANRPS